MPNFSIPLSGLTAASQALAVISNNLANLNTVGFKESRASFRDLFYQAFGTNGANDPIQVGEGVALGSVTPTSPAAISKAPACPPTRRSPATVFL